MQKKRFTAGKQNHRATQTETLLVPVLFQTLYQLSWVANLSDNSQMNTKDSLI